MSGANNNDGRVSFFLMLRLYIYALWRLIRRPGRAAPDWDRDGRDDD